MSEFAVIEYGACVWGYGRTKKEAIREAKKYFREFVRENRDDLEKYAPYFGIKSIKNLKLEIREIFTEEKRAVYVLPCSGRFFDNAGLESGERTKFKVVDGCIYCPSESVKRP